MTDGWVLGLPLEPSWQRSAGDLKYNTWNYFPEEEKPFSVT